MRLKFSRLIVGPYLAALIAAVPAPSVAGSPQWLPSDNWTVAMQGDHCLAALPFQHKSKQLQLVIQPSPTQPVATIYFVAEGDVDEYSWTDADVALGAHWTHGHGIQVMPSEQPHHIVYRWGMSDKSLDELAAAGRLQVSSKSFEVDLPVTHLESAIAQLKDCNSKVLERWGFGPDQQSRLATFPSVEKLNIKDSDYPAGAAKHGRIGNTDGYVMVGADGRPFNCHVIDSSGWPDLDSKACELLVERPQFKPAKDKDGQPMAAPYYFQFVWDIFPLRT